jgi:tetratricopeptide (TPR) repeat protein
VTALFRSSGNPRHEITVAAPSGGQRVVETTLVSAGSFSAGTFVRERFLASPDPVTRFLYAQFADGVDESLSVLDGLLEELPDFAQGHALRASRLLEKAAGEDGQTVPTPAQVGAIRAELGLAARLDPGSLDVRLTAARVLTALGDGGTALDQAAEAVRIGPDSGEARYRLGLLMVALDQAAPGVRNLRRAVTLNPYALEYYAALARGYLALGQRRNAEATIDAAKSLVDDPEIDRRLDQILGDRG